MTLTADRRYQVIDGLLQHRSMLVEQMAVWADCSKGVARELLGELAKDKLAKGKEIDSAGTKVWWLTTAGIAYARKHNYIEPTKKIHPAPFHIRGGKFTQHHIAVNRVGLAFLEDARARDEAMSWSHENAVPERNKIIKTDAIIKYGQVNPSPDLWWWFLELDRYDLARRPPHDLIAKLLRYERLMDSDKPWRKELYIPESVFPEVLVVLEVRSRATGLARIAAVEDHLRNLYKSQLPVRFCLLDDITKRGPFDMGLFAEPIEAMAG